MKVFWVLTATLVLIGGIAVSRPEVRNWLDQSMPSLGINGKNLSEASLAKTSETIQGTETDNPEISAGGGSELSPQNLVSIDPPYRGSDVSSIVEGQGAHVLLTQGGEPSAALPELPSPPNLNPRNGVSGDSMPGVGAALPNRATNGAQPFQSSPPPIQSNGGSIYANVATLHFVRTIDIAAQSDGIITDLMIDEGSHVAKDTPLVEIDSRIAMAEVLVQTRELDQAKLKAADKSQIEYAKAAYQVAKINAEISDDLVRRNSEDQSTNRSKKLELKKSELQITVSEIEHAKDNAAVAVSQAKLDAANVQIALRSIKAPWDGFVSVIEKQKYSYVRAGEVIFSFVDLSKVRVKAAIQATIPPHLLHKAHAKVRIAIAPNVYKEVEGEVGYVAYETIDSSSYQIWVEIENELLPDGQYLLRKGMPATIEIIPRNN